MKLSTAKNLCLKRQRKIHAVPGKKKKRPVPPDTIEYSPLKTECHTAI